MDGAKLTVKQWRDGAEVAPPADPVAALREQGSLVWVDLLAPTPEELGSIAEQIGLNPRAVEDALGEGERPKAGRYGEHLFLTVATVQLGDDRSTVARISAFVLPDGLLTVRRDDGVDLTPIVQAWQDNAALLWFGTIGLVHGLLDATVDGHFDVIQQLDDRVEELEDVLFDQGQGRHIQHRVHRLRRDLVTVRRVVLPMREIVEAVLRNRPDEHRHPELDGWFEDLRDHVLRSAEWTESLRDMVTAIFETNLSLQDAHLNEVMKKLAGWAAVIAVPTAVTGWFGQNIPFPGEGQLLGLVISVVLVLGGALGMWALLKRADWI